MIGKGKNQITSELEQKCQYNLCIQKDKERLQEETKHGMGKKKIKGLERERLSVSNHQRREWNSRNREMVAANIKEKNPRELRAYKRLFFLN